MSKNLRGNFKWMAVVGASLLGACGVPGDETTASGDELAQGAQELAARDVSVRLSTAKATFADRSGRTDSRKLTVSALMIHTSKKLAVIQMMSCFSRDSRINAITVASDNAAETAGRRSSISQKKLTRPQVNRKTTCETIPRSLHTMSESAQR